MEALPEARFTGLAEVYDRSRPDYPDEVLTLLESRCRLGSGSTVIDIGSGTGISTRWLAGKGWRVVGIEPNQDMRRQAEAVRFSGANPPTYRAGAGEATGLADATADLIVCAQAFHWLKPELALPEFGRILKPGGWAALIWNERDEADDFTADFGRIIRRDRESVRMEDRRQQAWRAFMDWPGFEEKERIEFRHRQELDEESLIGRAQSMSYFPREPGPREELIGALRECFGRWQIEGRVVMRYRTGLFVGKV